MTDRDGIAERLREAREKAGLTQQQAADWLEIRRPGVVEMETGRRAVKSDELVKLAQLYGSSISWLSGNDAGPEDHLVAALFRAGETNNPMLRAEASRLARRCHLVATAEVAIGATRRAALPQYTDRGALQERGRAMEHGRQVAYQERSRLGLGANAPLRDPWGIVEGAGLHVFPLRLGRDRQIDGVFARLPNGRVCAGVNVDAWVFRQVFTVIHEYAHAILDADVSAELCEPGRGWEQGHPGDYGRRELRANQFAAIFLVPREALLWYFEANGMLTRGATPRCAALSPADIVRAQDHFGVSADMLLWRLQNEDLINASARRELADRVRAEGVGSLAKRLGFAWRDQAQPMPRTFEIAAAAYRRGHLSLGGYAEVTGLSKEEAREQLDALDIHQEFADEDPLIGVA